MMPVRRPLVFPIAGNGPQALIRRLSDDFLTAQNLHALIDDAKIRYCACRRVDGQQKNEN
jgi:hypothetical protein